MTGAEWLACDDPREMLARMPATASERKCRLLACAFLRRLMTVTDHPAWASISLGERWADGAATEKEVRAFRRADPTEWAALVEPAHTLLHLCANVHGEAWRLVPGLLRELFGDPFRPTSVDPVWLTPAVLTLARAAYEERALPSGELEPARLAVLSDALEEAVCADGELLSHLRSSAPHVRGCWALDLILGKQ
jgi:hypothetical protein